MPQPESVSLGASGRGRWFRIVVTCSRTKRMDAPPQLRAGALRQRTVEGRLRAWLRRLGETEAPVILARDLYCGQHWKIATGLESLAANFGLQAELWVTSAGYGLIRADAPIKPYGATFALGADAVITSDGASDQRDAWWLGLSRWQGPEPGLPRTLAELAAAAPESRLLVVMSAAYMDAVREDLKAAAQHLGSDDQLLLIASDGTSVGEELLPYLLPVDSRALAVLGGSLVTLNARAARWLLKTAAIHRFERPVMNRLAQALVHSAPPSALRGVRVSNERVREFIRSQAAQPGEPMSATRLLRLLRRQGVACEQQRFSALYRAVVS